MQKTLSCLRAIGMMAIFFVGSSVLNKSLAQILTYTNDTGGAYSAVATHATGTSLTRVNGDVRPSSICTHGFSNRGFTTATSYSSILPAIQVSATPTTGYTLNVTGFSVGLRRSSTGPASVMLAYSTDGGTTWTSQGMAQSPNNSIYCDSIITATWSTVITVSSPGSLIFGIFGYGASSTLGTMQVLNLTINGSVGSGCTVPILTITHTNVSCNGASDGTATVTASGGTSPYTYSWAPSGGSAATATGLSAGTYSVTVTATGGCSTTSTVSITQPTALTATVSNTNELCFAGTTATASVTASGGTSPYTYSWAPSGGSSATATGLASGVYTCTISDAHGCTHSSAVTITQPAAITATISSTSISCSSGAGTATVTVSGGTAPYTYSWSPSGGTGATATGLSAGAYACTITDANGCTHTTTVTITSGISAPSGLSVSGITSSGAELHWLPVTGAASYNIEYRASGTTSWTTTTSSVDSVALTGLAYATTYDFQVQAVCSGGATSSYSSLDSFTTLTCYYPSGITVTSITSSSAIISWTGVTGAVSYTLGYRVSGTTTWHDTIVTGTSVTLTGLTAGTTYNYDLQTTCTGGGTSSYTTVANFTTSSGCTVPTLTVAVTNVTCHGGSNGSATVTAAGGTSPYTYSWAPSGGTAATATGLSAGSYTITVTATGGCTVNATVTITQPSALTATTTSTGVSCSSSTGSATVTVSGGTSPYTYSWAASGGSGATATGLVAGTYTCTIADAHGCALAEVFTITSTGLSAPTGLFVSGITSSGAELHWLPVTGAATYNIEYRKSGTTTWSTTTSSVDSVALSGLTYATTYDFQVQAVCPGGVTSSYSSLDSFTTLTCYYPSGVTVTSITSSSAIISWTGVTGAVSYTLGYRITGTTTWHDTVVTGTVVTLTGLTAGTSYDYDLQTTCSGGGTSSYTTTATFTTLTSSCGVPTGLTATSITSSSAILSWTAVTGATSYSIKYRLTAGTSWTTTTSTTTTLTLTGLAAASGYTFEVAAVCSSGTSAYSTTGAFTTLSCLVPTGIAVTSITTTSALIGWTAASGATTYNLGYRVTGSSTWHDTIVTVTSVTISGLTAGTSYDYEVQTVCAGGGTSPWSSTGTFSTLATTTSCGVPTGLTATSITSSSAVVSWTSVSGAISYKLKYKKTTSSGSTPWTFVSSTTTSVTITGLTYATSYTYEAEAICGTADSSSYSSGSTFTTLSCLYPSTITVSAITSTSATISWSGGSTATGYTLGYHTSGTTAWTDIIVTSSPYTLTGLSPDSTYIFDIQTTCSGGGTSSFSTTHSFTTTSGTTTSCGTATGLTATSITTTSAVLSWTAVSGATSYNIQYRATGTTTWSTTTTTTTSATVTGLSSSTTYEFQVQTVCSGGSGSFTSSAIFATLGACGVPSGLTAGTITTTSAILSWTAVTGATSYNVHYRISGTTTWTSTIAATTSVTITGLTAGSLYEFQVQTVCTSGSSGFSSSTNFTTTATTTTSGNPFIYYFTQPVDTSVRTGTPAICLSHCMADTLCAYINRANYSIDIAQYEYLSGAYANIATAINAAYTRGVKIRWIYDGTASETGMATLTTAIHTLASPTTSAYGIMHNKFVIIDVKSPNHLDPKVWTGSVDWTSEQFSNDYNNTVIIQDSALAHAYLNEFNMMWGDTGIAPNATLAKFGPYKTDLGAHTFTIGGKTVELYFSPSDGTNTHIESTINSSNTDMYFGMYTFTDNTDANLIVSRHTAGVYVAGIDDSYCSSYSPYTTFTSGLGSMFKVYTATGSTASVYHNKFVIVDPSNTCSDPMVLTGSHNWSSTADTKNDENTLIIHDATAANIYYQSFYKNFTSLGGSLTHVSAGSGCSTVYLREGEFGGNQAVNSMDNTSISIFPNPSDDKFTILYNLAISQNVTISITDYLGKSMNILVNNEIQDMGDHEYTFAPQMQGMYFIKMTIGNQVYIGKVVSRSSKRL